MSPTSSLSSNRPLSNKNATVEVSEQDFFSLADPMSSPVTSSLDELEPREKLLPEEILKAVRNVIAEPEELMTSSESVVRVYDLGFKASIISPKRYQQLKDYANRAIKEGKIFNFFGPGSVVIRALRRRGWVQVLAAHQDVGVRMILPANLTYQDAIIALPDLKPDEEIPAFIKRCEETILSLMVAREPVKLLWSNVRWQQKQFYDALCSPNIIFNKIGDPYFAPKHNLAKTVYKAINKNRISQVQLPRTYLLNEEKGMQMFLEDYKQTACLGFLKYVVETTEDRGIGSLFAKEIWHIPYTTFEFAYNRCTEFLQLLQLDGSFTKSRIATWDWDSFIQYHMLLISTKGKTIQAPPDKEIPFLIEKSKDLLSKIKECWPFYSMEGYRNTWIIKPRYSMAGRGITVTNKLSTIKKAATNDYLVQKYVEKPLLIFNTKGDIRQYFLVTRTVPLQVWMYADSYIRLSTQTYTLDNFDPSIHVTNTTVQNRYPVSRTRDPRLPNYNMLTSKAFQQYLHKINKPNIWMQKIYPGMKQAIIECLLANQEYLVQRPNNFELFGADFILDEDCTPWLMEINQNPLLALSNPVTTKLSTAIAEDIFKVVLDRPSNSKAFTGRFEPAFSQSVSEIPLSRNWTSIMQGKYMSKDDIRRQMYTHLIEAAKRR